MQMPGGAAVAHWPSVAMCDTHGACTATVSHMLGVLHESCTTIHALCESAASRAVSQAGAGVLADETPCLGSKVCEREHALSPLHSCWGAGSEVALSGTGCQGSVTAC
jgi:hypothetical protein